MSDCDGGGSDYEEEGPVVQEMIAKWKPGELAMLPVYAQTIVRANEDDDMRTVEKLSLALLEHDEMPAFYKAQAYAWLSSCEGYQRVSHMREAAFWIIRARDEKEWLHLTRKELANWTNLIWEHKDEAVAEAKGEEVATAEPM